MKIKISVSCLLIGASALSADWPEFQGAGRQNIWTETGVIESFEAGDLTRKWSVPVAAGYSGPTVAEGAGYVSRRTIQ